MRIVGIKDIFSRPYPVGVHADVTMSGSHGRHTVQRGRHRRHGDWRQSSIAVGYLCIPDRLYLKGHDWVDARVSYARFAGLLLSWSLLPIFIACKDEASDPLVKSIGLLEVMSSVR